MNTILLLHLLTSVLFSGLVFRRYSSMNHALSAAFLALMFPVGGVILIISVYYLQPKQLAHLEKTFEQERVVNRAAPALNVASEINVVPIEESLLVADKRLRRETVLNLLKKEGDDYTGFLLLALKNEDAETTHYAASSILHLQRKLDTQIMERSAEYHKHPDNPAVIQAYFDTLDRYTKMSDLDPVNQQKYQLQAVFLLKQIIAHSKTASIAHYHRLIELLMDTGNMAEAKRYCTFVDYFFNDTEDKLMHLLSSYFRMNDKAAFVSTRQKLMALPLPLSQHTARLMHFWESRSPEMLPGRNQGLQQEASPDNQRLH